MYTPKQFEQPESEAAFRAITENPFAIVCVADNDGTVQAVHVPTMFESGYGDLGRLEFHVAKQNPIWQLFDGAREALAMFSGPHAYISPDWYESDGLVPTWNYVAVHLAGTPHIIPQAQNATHLDALAEQQEAHLAPKPSWTSTRMDPDVHARMVKGIVGVVMPVKSIQAKTKLSQNRPPADKEGVVTGLRARGGDLNIAVADLMAARET